MELADQFEDQRGRLTAIAYRMLGSLPDADDAVQETWLRLQRTDSDGIDNLAGWLTTVVARICLNMLRARGVRAAEVHVPDPVVTAEPVLGPEDEAVLAESVGLAMLVVLDTVPAAERVAFVLHDMFGVPFDEIAEMAGRTPAAARQLASRARRRVQLASLVEPDPDLSRQRAVVDAFFAAARRGDFDALVGLLDENIVLRSDLGTRQPGGRLLLRGPQAVVGQARIGSQLDAVLHPVLVNGGAGVIVTVRDRPFAVMGFVVGDGRITEIDVVGGERLLRIADTLASAMEQPGPAGC